MKKATVLDKAAVVEILTESFYENNSIRFVVGENKSRIRVLMEYSFENCLYNGEVFISEDGASCALIKYSQRKSKPLSLILWDIKLAIMGIGLSNILKVMKRESLIEKTQIQEDFIYLWFIGVRPEMQGRGEGTKVLNYVSNIAAKSNLPIILETSTERNLPWYERAGFRIYHVSEEFGFPFYFFKK